MLSCGMQGCNPAVKDHDGCTPLYCAAAWNRAEAVQRLDALGCPSWARSQEGRTPMHVAAEQGWADLIDILVHQLNNEVSEALIAPELFAFQGFSAW